MATNGVCHARPRAAEVLDVFTCLHNKTTLAEAGRLLARNSERHLKIARGDGAAVRRSSGGDRQHAGDLVAAEIHAGGSGLSSSRDYPLPRGRDDIVVSAEAARTKARGGAISRITNGARQQIERELALIEKLKLGGYFLIVWDIVHFCREQGILVQGRGSAANSAVCYSLGITAVDPVGMDLLFERFLSEERGEWPDIDIDLPSGDQRERAIQYVYERYGKLGAAMTANVITYRGRSAAREAGKVLGFDVATLDKLSRLVPMWGWKDPDDTTEKQFREAGLDLANPQSAQVSGSRGGAAGSAAASGAAFGRHGDLPGAAGSRGAAGTGVHAGPRGGAVGQGRLRRHGDRQGRSAGAGDDGGAGGLPDADPRSLARRDRSGAACRRTIRKSTRRCRRRDTIGMFQVESRAQHGVRCRG